RAPSPSGPSGVLAVAGFALFGDPLLALPDLRGVRLAEVLGLGVRADLQDLPQPRPPVAGALLGPLDRLFERVDLPDPVPADDLLRHGERAIDHRGGAALHDHLGAR